MNSFIWNLIEINGLILLLVAVFYLVRKNLNFGLQRVVLISIPAIAVLTVALKGMFAFTNYAYVLPLIELKPVVVNAGQGAVDSGINLITPSWIYMVGGLIGGGLLIVRLAGVLTFFYRNKGIKDGGYRIYSVAGKDSFSFFNRIQVSPDLLGDDREIVLEHEKMHVNKRHSLDILVLELFHVLFWFNPVFILMKRELTRLHEFEVDGEMFRKHQVSYMQFLLDYSLGITSSDYLLTNRFYNRLTLKKRIEIMKTKTKNKRRLLLVFPIVALAIGSVQCTKENKHDIEEPVHIAVVEDKGSDDVVYKEVDVNPEFKGGEEAMVAYIGENVVYPKSAAAEGKQGVVYVQFIVGRTGEVKDVVVARPVDPELDQEAIRVIAAMPDWNPGEVNGEKVAVRYTLPISFRLHE